MYKLGIVGFGIVGKSALAFLNRQKARTVAPAGEGVLLDEATEAECYQINIWDERPLGMDEQEIIKIYKAGIVDSQTVGLDDFIKSNDYVIASPGVNINDFKHHSDKFLCELDFFSVFFNKPVIAITGSFGKTTITKLLGKLINAVPVQYAQAMIHGIQPGHLLHSAVGGNVGVGMLDLIQQQDAYDLAVLELSSFQLELNKKFAPDLALLTNFYPNHLDRHQTELEYFEAKFNLFRFQREHQYTLFDADILRGSAGQWLNDRLETLKSSVYFFTAHVFDDMLLSMIKRPNYGVFYCDGSWICQADVKDGLVTIRERLFDMSIVPDITFVHNWVAVISSLYLLGTDLKYLHDFLATTQESLLTDHHHRLEYCATVAGVDFYNDSKSTVMQTTLAAVEKLALQGRPITLIVGGLGKGVDRAPFMATLRAMPGVKRMYCFGKECDVQWGCLMFQTLEAVMDDIAQTMQSGDIVLLSPGGASYDLFKHYEHRGQVFQQLVHKMAL